MLDTAEREAVRNSIFWELRYEKLENQMNQHIIVKAEIKVRQTVITITRVLYRAHRSQSTGNDDKTRAYSYCYEQINHLAM